MASAKNHQDSKCKKIKKLPLHTDVCERERGRGWSASDEGAHLIKKQLSERGCAICLVHNRIRKCVCIWWTSTASVASHTITHWPSIREPGAAACYEEQKSVVSPVRRRSGHIHVCLNYIADEQRSWTLRLTLKWGTHQNTGVCPAIVMRYYRLSR